jgi:outer membrane receptor protein involved in Fe transport
VTVLGRLVLRDTPGVNLDDRLRMVPGFTLFRRSSSLTANPTTQGVSLRGLGSSGASRTLVLWDGVPLNDPFGGWVYWTRVAPETVDRVELSRGASTSLFGDRALGGSIALISRPIERSHVYVGFEGGNLKQLSPSAGLWSRTRNWGYGAQARAFRTDGYFIVPANVRGAVDAKANVEFVAGDARIERTGNNDRFVMKVDGLGESRGNGTPVQTNSTTIGAISGSYSHQWADDVVTLTAFHQRQEFRAGFSALAADRNTERLTFRQSVPAQATGGSAIWRRENAQWNLFTGADFHRVNGVSYDFLVPSGVRSGGGVLFQRGFFAQSEYKWKAARLFAGVRQQFTGLDQARRFLSPSGGFTVGRRRWRLRGSAYRAYRAPTLNELYREFRAGNTVTLANAALEPERLFGAELGIDHVGERGRFSLGVFRNEMEGIITNVTLSATPQLVTRQRRNLTSAVGRGIEAEWRYQGRGWRWDSSYLYTEARVGTRERVAQIPKHQGSAQLGWQMGRLGPQMAFGFRASGLQFEDDRNTQLLPGFMTWLVSAQQKLKAGWTATAGMENAFERQYLTGFTPAPQIGPPRLWRIGLRWEK